MNTAESHRGIEGKSVKQEETQRQPANSASGGTLRATTGAARAISADELDPGRERRPLESYFQEIGGTRTLRREEEALALLRLSPREPATIQLCMIVAHVDPHHTVPATP